MTSYRLWSFTAAAMLAFAANSLLCRMALAHGHVDPASFTAVRLLSGALTLWGLYQVSAKYKPPGQLPGSWAGAIALFVYAAGFSFAYVQLNTATGALILFAAVQLGMIGFGLWRGETFRLSQWGGLLCALLGLAYLLVPSATRPDLQAAALMTLAGIAWAVYSLLGKTVTQPLAFTTGNFIRASLLALPLLLMFSSSLAVNYQGALLAVASGALASGLGYAVWYAVLPRLQSMTAASVQLSVPVLAALMGVALLAEPLTLTLTLASAAILLGVMAVIRGRH